MVREQNNDGEDRVETNNNDNVAGWIDEREGLSREELEALEESMHPIWLVLVKVGSTLKTYLHAKWAH